MTRIMYPQLRYPQLRRMSFSSNNNIHLQACHGAHSSTL
ncbi:hypothetical protein SOHN41_03584 [Shewanella sp. HN-41]|nr:hypothetical protein SOHN41_03584 [Shewanella sp. HN-41]